MTDGRDQSTPRVPAAGGRARRRPVAAVAAVALGLLVLAGSVFGGALRFGEPRWRPGAGPRATPPPPPSQPLSRPSATPQAAAGSGPDLTWVLVTLGILALVAIAALVVRWLLRRRRSTAAPAALQNLETVSGVDDPSVETSAPYLRRGLRRALDELNGGRAPGDAIVAAWLGLQEAAEDAGYRRLDAETPTEFTSRILASTGVDADALDTLRRLYLGVRFGDAVATDGDVASARGALLRLEAQWHVEPVGGDTA